MGLGENSQLEIRKLRKRCEEAGYTKAALEDFLQGIEKRALHPMEDGASDSCTAALNELALCLSDQFLRAPAWEVVSRIATEDDGELREMLRVTILEVLAEPPEVEYTLELLFSLAENSATRWAVLAAYENYPWRLRPHARKYSRGLVTDDDCDQWLIDQDLGHDEILMARDQ